MMKHLVEVNPAIGAATTYTIRFVCPECGKFFVKIKNMRLQTSLTYNRTCSSCKSKNAIKVFLPNEIMVVKRLSPDTVKESTNVSKNESTLDSIIDK